MRRPRASGCASADQAGRCARSTKRRIFAALAGLVAASACGSTVTPAQLAAAGGNQSAGTSATFNAGGLPTSVSRSAGAAGALPGAGPAGLTSNTPSGGSAPGGLSSGGGAPNSTFAGGAAPTSGSGLPGITATTVYVGIPYSNDQAAYTSQFGVKDAAATESAEAVYNAIIADINSHGGVLHRKLSAVYYPHGSEEARSSLQAAECASFTQDHHVVAAMNVSNIEYAPVAQCLLQHRALMIQQGIDPGDQGFDQTYPNVVTPGLMELTTIGRVMVDALAAHGFFPRGARIGVLYFDTPSYQRAYDNGVKPALAALGLSATDAIPIPYGTTQANNTPAADQSAELRFRTENINRVLMLDAGAGISEFFATYAASQQYYPHYGISSLDGGTFLAANLTASELAGAQGVSYWPTYDVDAAHDPDSNVAAQRCISVMKAHGLWPSDRTTQAGELIVCTDLYFLQTLLNATQQLTFAGVQAAIAGLGSSFVPASGFADSYANNKHWGAAAYRPLVYQSSCSCFTFEGPTAGLG